MSNARAKNSTIKDDIPIKNKLNFDNIDSKKTISKPKIQLLDLRKIKTFNKNESKENNPFYNSSGTKTNTTPNGKPPCDLKGRNIIDKLDEAKRDRNLRL